LDLEARIAAARAGSTRSGSTISRVTNTALQEAQNTLTYLRNFVENPNFGGSGIAASFAIESEREQRVTLMASHVPVKPTSFQAGCSTQIIGYFINGRPRFGISCSASGTLDIKSDTSIIDIYTGSVASGSWTKIGSTTSRTFSVQNIPYNGELAFVAKNKFIGRLYSRPVIQDTTLCMPRKTCILTGQPDYNPSYVLYD